MNTRTYQKISRYAAHLDKIHADRDQYKFIIPLLDEPYQLALKILEFGDAVDDAEVGRQLSINWQTVKQIRRALS